MKKVLSLLMTIILCLSFFAGCGESNDVETSDGSDDLASTVESLDDTVNEDIIETPASDFEYAKNKDGSFTIFYYKGESPNVVVPKEIDGSPVTQIMRFTENSIFSDKIVSLILPEGLKIINNSAFEGCTALENVSLPDSLEYIGSKAFRGCTSLKHIKIPGNCWDENSSGVFSESGLETVDLAEGVEIIPMQTFWNTNLKNIVLPSTVKKIGFQAFYGCKKIENITLNHGLTAIEQSAFQESALKEITLPETITEMDEYSFDGCNKLEKVIFVGDAPKNFIKKDYWLYMSAPKNYGYTIYYNSDAEGFETPKWYGYTTKIVDAETEGLPVFDNYEYMETAEAITITDYFGNESNVVIPAQINGKNVVKIGVSAFKDNKAMVSVGIPDTVLVIEDRAFSGCKNLEKVDFSDNLQSIGIIAFAGCDSLTSIKFPNDLTTIGNKAFNNLSNLKEITIPKSVVNWGDSTFFATQLETIVLENGLTTIGKSAFSSTNVTEIIIPESITNIGKNAFDSCSSLKSIYFEGNAPEIYSEEECGMGGGNAIVYYREGAEGFTSPEWNGYNTEIW